MVDAVSSSIRVLGIMVGTCVSENTSPTCAYCTSTFSGQNVMIRPGVLDFQHATFGFVTPLVPGTSVTVVDAWSTWANVAAEDTVVFGSVLVVDWLLPLFECWLFCCSMALGGLYLASISKAEFVVLGYRFSPCVMNISRSANSCEYLLMSAHKKKIIALYFFCGAF